MTSSIYLSGSTTEPMPYRAELCEPDWRSHATTKLHRYGLRVLNPLEIACPSAQTDPGQAHVRRALDLIDQCDALLANLARPSYATAMEIFYAHRLGKVVTVVGHQPFNPWVLTHSRARFEDMDRALDYLIGEQPHLDPVVWALQFEGQLAEHYEEFPPAGEYDYKFLGGDVPVLLVAPHATAHFRDGEVHEPDRFTGSLAALLHRTAKCHALLSVYCCAADPFYHVPTPMQRAYADIVKTGQIALVLFLLGAQWHEAAGLQVSAYTVDNTTVEDYASHLRMQLSAIEPVATEPLAGRVPPLVRFTVEELNIPSLVLQIHKRYRMPRLQPLLFERVVRLTDEALASIGNELLRGS